MPDTEGVPRDREARPSLDEVLALRADSMAMMRRVVDELTDERLAGSTEPVLGPGWPESRSYPVRDVLGVVLNEEWWHRQFAERDLALMLDPAHSRLIQRRAVSKRRSGHPDSRYREGE